MVLYVSAGLASSSSSAARSRFLFGVEAFVGHMESFSTVPVALVRFFPFLGIDMYEFSLFAESAELNGDIANALSAVFSLFGGFLLVLSCYELMRLPRKRVLVPKELFEGFQDSKYAGLSSKHLEYMIVRWDLSDEEKDEMLRDPTFRELTESQLEWICISGKAQLDMILRERIGCWQTIFMGVALIVFSLLMSAKVGPIGFVTTATCFVLGVLLASILSYFIRGINHRRRAALAIELLDESKQIKEEPPPSAGEYA
jgi:hypothetical protein